MGCIAILWFLISLSDVFHGIRCNNGEAIRDTCSKEDICDINDSPLSNSVTAAQQQAGDGLFYLIRVLTQLITPLLLSTTLYLVATHCLPRWIPMLSLRKQPPPVAKQAAAQRAKQTAQPARPSKAARNPEPESRPSSKNQTPRSETPSLKTTSKAAESSKSSGFAVKGNRTRKKKGKSGANKSGVSDEATKAAETPNPTSLICDQWLALAGSSDVSLVQFLAQLESHHSATFEGIKDLVKTHGVVSLIFVSLLASRSFL